jgi:hypothetical protein
MLGDRIRVWKFGGVRVKTLQIEKDQGEACVRGRTKLSFLFEDSLWEYHETNGRRGKGPRRRLERCWKLDTAWIKIRIGGDVGLWVCTPEEAVCRR